MSENFFLSGYIMHRGRKIGIVWTGQSAVHICENARLHPKTHPLTHLRIQQLAAKATFWRKLSRYRHTTITEDHKTGIAHFIAIDVFPKFAVIVTSYISNPTL